MEDQLVQSGVEVALYAPIIIALVEAVKQALPEKFGGLATILVAVGFGALIGFLSPLSLAEGVSSALVAVGAITFKRAGVTKSTVTK